MHDLDASGTCGTGFLDLLRPRRHAWQVTVDLTRMRFCEPLGLVGIATHVEHAARAGERVVVRRPHDPNVANYLARMRLGHLLAALGAEHDLPWVHEHDVGDALLELTPFDGARGAGELGAHVHHVVAPVDLAAANALHEGICEAGQNVAHHSGQERGFVAAQRTHGGDVLTFAVGDSGLGMLATLRSRGAVDDADALERALRPGVTTTADPFRGNGLPTVVEQLSHLRGRLDMTSGHAAVVARGGRRWFTRRPAAFSGTLLQGSVLVTAR